jgi:hypothetical protein
MKLFCQAWSLIRGAAQDVSVVEVVEELVEVGGTVGHDGGLDPLEHRPVHALGVVIGLEQERGDLPHEDGLAHSDRSVGTQVASDFTGAH